MLRSIKKFLFPETKQKGHDCKEDIIKYPRKMYSIYPGKTIDFTEFLDAPLNAIFTFSYITDYSFEDEKECYYDSAEDDFEV